MFKFGTKVKIITKEAGSQDVFELTADFDEWWVQRVIGALLRVLGLVSRTRGAANMCCTRRMKPSEWLAQL